MTVVVVNTQTMEIFPHSPSIKILSEARGVWLGYIDRKIFDEQYEIPDKFYGYPTEIKKPELTWTVTEQEYDFSSTDESGFVSGNAYYYRFSYIYDGVQEGLLSENVIKWIPSDNYKFVKLTSEEFDCSTSVVFNKRITAIKIYRSHYDATTNIRTPYEHIHTINILRLSKDILKDATDDGYYYENGVAIPACATETFQGGSVYTLDVDGSGFNAITNPGAGTGHFHFDWAIAPSAGWNVAWTMKEDGGAFASGTSGAYENNVAGEHIISFNQETGDDNYLDGVIVFNPAGTLHYLVIKNNVNVSGYGGFVKTKHCAIYAADYEDKPWWLFNSDKGLYKVDEDTNKITLTFFDTMLSTGAEHPLAGEVSIKVNGKIAKIVGGRLWQGDIVLDPGGENEVHHDWVSYSELGQLDVNPVSNVFTISDPEGGKVTGIADIFGNPVITKKQTIVTINTKYYPDDPLKWSVLESIHNIGNIAEHGIINILGSLYVCYYDGIYKLSPNNLAETDATPTENLKISDPIGDVYETLTLDQKEDIQSEYDPLKNEIIFTFNTDVWAYSIVTGAWRQIDSDITVTLMSTDENAQIMVYDATDKKIYSFDVDDSVEISMKTKTFAISDEREEVIRYLYVTYQSASDLTVNLYAENAAVAVWTDTLPANSVSTTYLLVIRYRAKKFSLEILDSVASATDTEIERIKIMHD